MYTKTPYGCRRSLLRLLGPLEGSGDHLARRLVPVLAVLHNEAAAWIPGQHAAAGDGDNGLEGDVEAQVLVKLELDLGRVGLDLADQPDLALVLDEQRGGALDELGQGVGVDLVGEEGGLIVDGACEVGRRQKLPP